MHVSPSIYPITEICPLPVLERSFPSAELEYRLCQFWSMVMTSDVYRSWWKFSGILTWIVKDLTDLPGLCQIPSEILMRTFAFLYNRTIGLGSHNTPVLYAFKIPSNPRRSLKNFLGLITVIAKAIEQFEKKMISGPQSLLQIFTFTCYKSVCLISCEPQMTSTQLNYWDNVN